MIRKHTYASSISSPSPNKGGVIQPKFIVMHYTASWTVDSVLTRFANPSSRVSAHVTIDTDGTVYQHVPFNRRAWHAGKSAFGGYSGLNGHSIGIEIVNPGYLRRGRPGELIDAYGQARSEDKVGPTVRQPHTRVGSGVFYWPLYTKAQIEACINLTEELIAAYDILDIVTHEEIDLRGWKTDPGPAFPMNQFKKLLGDRCNDEEWYRVTASLLNVRSGPGTRFEVIDTLRRGAVVEEIGRRREWMRISADGWVHADFLQLEA